MAIIQVISIFLLTSTSLISSCGAGSFVGSAAKSGSKKTSTIMVDEGGEICSKTRPVIGDVQPVEKWHWSGWRSPSGVKYGTTYSSPVAADLDQDGKTEIVVIASTIPNYRSANGTLVVLEGATGIPLFNSLEVLGPDGGAMVSTTPILVDLDKDGVSEIIFASFENQAASSIKIIAIDYKTRSIKHTFSNSSLICGDNRVFCIGAAGDLDGDGSMEVIFGNMILDHKLTLKKSLSDIGAAEPATVTIADLDQTSIGLELIINGSSVFSSAGNKLWQGACAGYSAVSDINNDGVNELICVGGAKLTTYTSSGVQLWQSAIPFEETMPANLRGVGGGPPNVGNFLGDAKFEIGLAGGDYYVVFDNQGREVWKQRTADRSSLRTGSTIFDFNGDGKMEVIYNDQDKLRIYSGETGEILWATENQSGTLWEYPLVVNVDDDMSSEIVVNSPPSVADITASPPLAVEPRGGVRVFEDPKNLWMYSRRVWNQYSYFPELVDDLLKSTPIFGQTVRHGFRVNSQGLNPSVKIPCK